MFNSVENASTIFDKLTEVHPRDDSDLKPEYCPSYPIVIANVSVGDGSHHGHATHDPGQEAKSLAFIDRNVICCIDYHDVTSYDLLSNDLLMDPAKKVHAKIG